MSNIVTPTRDQIAAKALQLYMEEMYAKGMRDVPTPQIPTEEEEKAGVTNELREGNYWQRAIEELMKSPETLAWEEETKALDMMASQTEEVMVPANTVKKLLESARDLEAAEGKARDARRKEKETRKQAEEKIRELQSELEALREEAKKKPALRIRILQNFKEGIQYFKKGDVIETHNIEWALAKVDQKLAERVGVEVPVKILPEAPPKVEKRLHKFLTNEQVEMVWQEFVRYAKFHYPALFVEPELYRVRFEGRIKDAKTIDEANVKATRLVEEIVRELRPKFPAPPAPPTPPALPPPFLADSIAAI